VETGEPRICQTAMVLPEGVSLLSIMWSNIGTNAK